MHLRPPKSRLKIVNKCRISPVLLAWHLCLRTCCPIFKNQFWENFKPGNSKNCHQTGHIFKLRLCSSTFQKRLASVSSKLWVCPSVKLSEPPRCWIPSSRADINWPEKLFLLALTLLLLASVSNWFRTKWKHLFIREQLCQHSVLNSSAKLSGLRRLLASVSRTSSKLLMRKLNPLFFFNWIQSD